MNRSEPRSGDLRALQGLAAALALLLAFPPPALAAPPGRAEALYERGARALRQGDVEEAVEKLAQAVELAPEDPQALSLYGQALLTAGRPEEAGGVLERLRAIDPQAPGLEYFRGLASYRLGDWEATRQHLSAAREATPDSGRVHLYLGIAHQELGDPEAAERELREAARLDPELRGQASYRLGLLALEQKRFDQARKHFEEVGARLPGSALARSAAAYLSRLERGPARRWDAYLTVGGGYDSNVNLVNDDELVGPSEKDDGFGVGEIGLSALVYDDERFSARVGQIGYIKYHGDETDFDQGRIRTWAQGSWKAADRLRLGLRYSFEYIWVNWDSFRRTHAVEPSLRWVPNQKFLTNVFLRYDDRIFFPSTPNNPELDRDGGVYKVGFDQYYFLPDWMGWGGGYVRAGYRFRRESTDGDEFDSIGNEPVLTLGFSLPQDIFLTIDGRYEWRDFDHPSSLFKAPQGDRDDEIARLRVGFSRPFGRHIVLELGYRYTDRSSNVDLVEYHRHVGEFLATYRY